MHLSNPVSTLQKLYLCTTCEGKNKNSLRGEYGVMTTWWGRIKSLIDYSNIIITESFLSRVHEIFSNVRSDAKVIPLSMFWGFSPSSPHAQLVILTWTQQLEKESRNDRITRHLLLNTVWCLSDTSTTSSMKHGEEERQTEVWSGADMQRLGVPLPSWRETTSGGLCRSVIMVQTESSLLQYVVTATAVQCRAGLLPRRLFASSQSVEKLHMLPDGSPL